MIISTGNYSSKSRKQILILWLGTLLLIEVLAIYSLTLKKIIYYENYKINSKNYTLINARVIDKKEKKILYDKIPVFKIPMVKVEYQINKNTYCDWISYNFDCFQNDMIEVAVKKDNYGTIVPIQPPYLSKYEKGLYLIFLFVDIAVFLIIFIFFKREKRKEIVLNREYNKEHGTKTRYEKAKESNAIDKMKKREMLEGIISKNLRLNNPIIINDIKNVYCEEYIKLNEDSIWYLDLIESYKTYCGLLYLSEKSNDSFLAIDITLDLWEQGLPRDYYIVDMADNYYYCCTEDSERVYMYSKSLGITNTQYTDLLDYILEKVKLYF